MNTQRKHAQLNTIHSVNRHLTLTICLQRSFIQRLQTLTHRHIGNNEQQLTLLIVNISDIHLTMKLNSKHLKHPNNMHHFQNIQLLLSLIEFCQEAVSAGRARVSCLQQLLLFHCPQLSIFITISIFVCKHKDSGERQQK